MKKLLQKLKKDLVKAAIESVRAHDTTRLMNYVNAYSLLKKKRK